MLKRILCLIGWHGPVVYGPSQCHRSMMFKGFERTCLDCGATWRGRMVERNEGTLRHHRGLGEWEQVS